MKVLENPVYVFFTNVGNLFLLNLLFFVSCLPIVTIFPATTAMVSVIRQWKVKGESAVLKPYLVQFKRNFKQSLLISLVWIPFGILLYFNYFLIIQVYSQWSTLLLIPIFLIAIVFLFMTAFLFPIMAHYKLTFKNILKNSFIISVAFFPTTILNVLIGALFVTILLFVPFFATFAFSVGAYINFSLCHRCFKKINLILAD